MTIFLIDPHTGEIELGSADDIVHFTSSIYYCPPEEMLQSEERHKIEIASHKYGGNELLLFVATKDASPQTDTKVEIWQDETLMGSCEYNERANYNFYERTFTYDDENGDRTHYQAERHKYIFPVLGMEDLDPDRPVTVKLYGGDGELQMEESIQLSKD